MHRRNITLLAALLAAIITSCVEFIPGLERMSVLGFLYFPEILLTVILSGGSHSPSAFAGWSAFVVYTLSYLFVFVILYALLTEIYLLRRAFHHLENENRSFKAVAGESGSETYLRQIGAALKEIEPRRRNRWVLQNLDGLNLADPPALLAAQAITHFGNERTVRGLLKRLQSNLVTELGSQQADAAIAKLKQDALHYKAQGAV